MALARSLSDVEQEERRLGDITAARIALMPRELELRREGVLVKRYMAGLVSQEAVLNAAEPDGPGLAFVTISVAAQVAGVSWPLLQRALEHLQRQGNTLTTWTQQKRKTRSDAFRHTFRDAGSDEQVDGGRESEDE